MVTIPFFQLDAFATKPFTGNPAAVCLLEHQAETGWMQSVAAEMNLSETAFVRRLTDDYELRWFTPTIEVALCGHATLAAAHALWAQGVVRNDEPIRFHTKSGVLTCSQSGEFIQLDFPAMPATQSDPPAGLLDVLGIRPSFVGKSTFDKLLVVESEEIVRSLTQGAQFVGLARLPAVTVTLCFSFTPVAVALAGIWFLGERPTLIQWCGVVLFLAGALTYFYPVAFPVEQEVGLAVLGVAALLAQLRLSQLGKEEPRDHDAFKNQDKRPSGSC